MGKLPAFLFYIKDWLTDPALCRVSKTARATWMDMLCLMFNSEERGFLVSGDSVWLDEEIAAAVRGDVEGNLRDIAELLAKGVASRDHRGAIFSRRLVRDEELRQADAKRVRRFRRKQKCNADVTLDVTPLSVTANATAIVSGNEVFKRISESYISEVYKFYPRKEKRVSGYKAIAAALERLLKGQESPGGMFNSLDDAVVYLAQRVKLFAASEAGRAGSYTPLPASWFNEKRYLDDESNWSRNNGKQHSIFDERDKARAAIIAKTAAMGS